MIRPDILAALELLQQNISQAIPEDESGEALKSQFSATLDALRNNQEFAFLAEDLLTGLITHYPNLTPAIPRELLWSIGGSCLHFLGDEEIDAFAEQTERDATRH
ncbi:MAG: hypothetical protein AseanaTS_31380 [Candidatus Pelagadaptatus aseana]